VRACFPTAVRLLLVGIAAGGCAPAQDAPPSDAPPAAQGNLAEAPAASPGTSPGVERDTVVMIVEASGATLRVISAKRVSAERIGRSARFNGKGRVTHRWRLVDAAGNVTLEGDIAAGREPHVAPHGSDPAAHATPAVSTFVVRAPHPGDGEHIEITTVDDGARLVWP
jgi:hypothetical protein